MILIQPIVDSLAGGTKDSGIPDLGVRLSIAVVVTFLLAITSLLLYLKARESDQAESNGSRGKEDLIN